VQKQIDTLFQDAAQSVLEEIGFQDISIRQTDIQTQNDTKTWEIVSMVGLVGALRGHLVLHFPLHSSQPFVVSLSKYLGMDKEDHSLQYIKSALAEVANQISGKATALLSEEGLDCMITPPTILSGTALSLVLPESDEQHGFTISGNFGAIFCVLALKNSKLI
jgi:CheY-specific phosphatase CheX